MAKHQILLDLERDGYVVVPNVISSEVCEAFIEEAWSWLESFPYGFKRDDRSTWTKEHLPFGQEKGLYNRYSVNHEDFVWKIRTQPGILKVFEQVWGTDDLIASFDGMNVSLPINERFGRTDIAPTKPWPHLDQDPRTIERLELYQGIANLSTNGPEDGGLVVLSGSHRLHKKHFESIGGFRKDSDLGHGANGYMYLDDDADWYRNEGCKEVKICANAGDLILWDSRTIHWNSAPTGDRTRFATYVCYCARDRMSEEDLQKKMGVWEAKKGTTHWPVGVIRYFNCRFQADHLTTEHEHCPD